MKPDRPLPARGLLGPLFRESDLPDLQVAGTEGPCEIKENCMAKELYVGNLPYDATEDDLRRLFAVAGTVTSVHLITDSETGMSKGCAYVRMASEEALAEAIESLDGALMGERLITVNLARPQKQQGRQPGGYRRRPGGGARPGKGRK